MDEARTGQSTRVPVDAGKETERGLADTLTVGRSSADGVLVCTSRLVVRTDGWMV